jgi:hypothetical protein
MMRPRAQLGLETADGPVVRPRVLTCELPLVSGILCTASSPDVGARSPRPRVYSRCVAGRIPWAGPGEVMMPVPSASPTRGLRDESNSLDVVHGLFYQPGRADGNHWRFVQAKDPNMLHQDLLHQDLLHRDSALQAFSFRVIRTRCHDEFERRADECRRLAAAARNDRDRAFWLSLVQRWQLVERRRPVLTVPRRRLERSRRFDRST